MVLTSLVFFELYTSYSLFTLADDLSTLMLANAFIHKPIALTNITNGWDQLGKNYSTFALDIKDIQLSIKPSLFLR